MEEQWKLYRKTKSPDFSYYFSDQGRVKLVTPISEDILEIGKGLYIEDTELPNIKVVGISDNIYRIIWRLFKGDIPKWYQIHHIDYNHTNNRLDNLICVHPKDHGFFHSFQGKLELGLELNEFEKQCNERYIQSLDTINKLIKHIDNKDQYINDWKEYIKQLKPKVLEYTKEYNRQQTKQRRLDKQQQIYNDKLNSGKFIEVNGKLKRIMSEYQKQRMAEGRRNKCYNNIEWRRKVSEGNKKYQQSKNK